MIDFQRPFGLNYSKKYVSDCLDSGRLSGDGKYTALCRKWLTERFSVPDALMTTSCTHALELALYMLDLGPGDEVIVPSYTYPSTANAVLMAGGKVVFSQVRQKDLTLDPARLEEKISSKTKAVIPVHYAGNVCQMDEIMGIAKTYGLMVIEDSAQGFLSSFKGQYAGTFGDFGCFSFHGTKDLVAGEGGALFVNNTGFLEAAKIFRGKGTNREAFLQGKVDRYEWVSRGSSYSPSDLLMAVLYGQLEQADIVVALRQKIFRRYENFFTKKNYGALLDFSRTGDDRVNNGHVYWLNFRSGELGEAARNYLKARGISAYSHFVPLHSSHFGSGLPLEGTFDVEKDLGKKLVRLPLYPDLTQEEQSMVLSAVDDFMEAR